MSITTNSSSKNINKISAPNSSARLSKWFHKIWQNKNIYSLLLLPLSLFFCFLVSLRRLAYRKKLMSSSAFPIPIIIVGNISVGGTGKTPLLIFLVKQLQKKGYNVGVISRGYGATSQRVKQGKSLCITASMSAQEVGDEPFLIAHQTKATVIIGHQRVLSVQKIIEETGCDVILSDDGLQHYALQRHVEICVIDQQKLLGNGFCLPAGPLREKVSRLDETDFTIFNEPVKSIKDDSHKSNEINDRTNFSISELSSQFKMSLSIDSMYQLGELFQNQSLDRNDSELAVDKLAKSIQAEDVNCISLEKFKNTSVHAIAGIGNPSRFFSQLRDLDIDLIEHPFSDHHDYTKSDFQFNDDLPILMTEKDAVKCSFFTGCKELSKLWVVPVKVQLSEDLIDSICQKI